MSRSKWIVLAIVLVVIAGAVFALSSGGASGGLVDSTKFQSLVDDGVKVVDVRTAAEFEMGHIPGASNVPVNEIASAAADWDTSEPIALYCASGSRSAEAAATLSSLGFTTVYDLSGGVAQWAGDLESGTAVATTTEPSASGLPVMYEFYTDW